MKGLRRINVGLPASVYVPFINMRNCSILNIEVSETKLFITNHRAPFMVAFEVWRPAEEVSVQVSMQTQYQNENNQIDQDLTAVLKMQDKEEQALEAIKKLKKKCEKAMN